MNTNLILIHFSAQVKPKNQLNLSLIPFVNTAPDLKDFISFFFSHLLNSCTHIYIFIWGFTSLFNTVLGISRQVVLWAEETNTCKVKILYNPQIVHDHVMITRLFVENVPVG